MQGIRKMIIERFHTFFYNLKNTRESSEIWENELPRKSIGKSQNEIFHQCHDDPLNYSSIPSEVSRDASKGTTSQRRTRLHRGPLNLPE
jgi:hypothetical protein